jgi:hypothetical protein
MMKLAPLAMQDSSFIEACQNKAGDYGRRGEGQYQRMMTDPTHKFYEDFERGGKASSDYINDFYRRAVGTGKVKIGEGVSV